MHLSLLETLLGLLFPDRCSGCGARGALFCAACCATLHAYPPEPVGRLDGLAMVQIAFVYDGPLRAAVHALKYRGRRRIARPLGQLMAEKLCGIPEVDAVVPVPLHAVRLAERGYNQAEALAQAMVATRLPIINDQLVRIRTTGQQARLSARERRENTRAAFAWQAQTPPPARLLLVDDIFTTGATMDACACALRDAGAQQVYGIALARSLSKS